ncbi:hypothetical protein EX30DRAFT_337121 [Ascodesmis nigricans]|uniref:DUF3140 domain-containing protein n=1 Tax=Ascodesmis nigricans TaxID=341454 RepID=A0A4S2N5U5_9PEZI|nr:hypothetical protein EX30DRAFT_337121 [Ascodesmis nigricans]
MLSRWIPRTIPRYTRLHFTNFDLQSTFFTSSGFRNFGSSSTTMKDTSTVISEFNELVNMNVPELQDWLKTEASTSSGWHHNAGDSETVGHASGRHIVEILKKNPKKDPAEYDDDDIAHMRKVVSYCKRHLAQEETAKKNTESKSYKSLKNWGHDAQKE